MGEVQKLSVAPVSAAMASHSAMSALSGKYSSGAQAVKLMPILAQPTMSELPMLKRESPIYTNLMPFRVPKCSLIVRKSASI